MYKIGIWNTAFLGDAVLTLPLLRSLKDAYPEAELHFWVRGGLGSLFASQPELARVHEYHKRGPQKSLRAALALGRGIARQDYGLWISAHTSLRSGLIARWSSIKTRIGYNRPLHNSFFYTHTVDRRFGELDEIERLLQLLKPLGVPPTTHWPELALAPDAVQKAAGFWDRTLGSGDAKTPVLGVHPGSVWPTKRWPVEYYAQVVRQAVDAGARVLVFGGPGEEPDAAAVVEQSGTADSGSVHDISGTLSLPELAAFLGRLDCYLSNDSGPMHLAWCQRVPVVAVFGPTVRALGFFPRGERTTVLENTHLPCRPCGLHGPKECPQGHFDCMRTVTPDMAWAAVRERLEPAGGGRG